MTEEEYKKYQDRLSEKEFKELDKRYQSYLKELEQRKEYESRKESLLDEKGVRDVKGAVEEALKVIEHETNYDSLSTLASGVVETTYVDPLNPKTDASINYGAYLEKLYGAEAKQSKQFGKRYISIQAFSYGAIQDWYYEAGPLGSPYLEKGLIISTVTKPDNGSGWDEVASVVDITGYVPSTWYGGTAPNSSNKLTTLQTSGHIKLLYSSTAFNTAPGYTSPANVGGIYTIKLQVTFVSGHVEIFDIKAPVARSYTHLNLGYSGVSTSLYQGVSACLREDRWNWYSKGYNEFQSHVKLTSDYSILTRYKPFTSTGQQELGYFEEYNASATPSFGLINGFIAWQDPLALEFGVNGIITPDSSTTARQEFHRIDVVAQQNNNNYPSTIDGKNTSWFNANYTSTTNGIVDDTYTGNAPTSFDSVLSSIGLQLQTQQLFTYTIYYAENLTSCVRRDDPTTGKWFVCNASNNPSYFVTTGLDCSGNTIPATYMPGGTLYNPLAFTPSDCCTDCDSFGINSVYDIDQVTYGVNDGGIAWDVASGGVASGNPWNSGSQYTVTITDASGTPVGTAYPTGGNVVLDATCDTQNNYATVNCDATPHIKQGMQVSASNISTTTGNGIVYVGQIFTGTTGIDVSYFELVDSLGNSVTASSTLTNTTLTFSTGYWGVFQGLAPNTGANPYYIFCITDESGCEECTRFQVEYNPEKPRGCTDNTAINYDSAAVTDDGSCILCKETTGLLEDPNGTASTHMFDPNPSTGTADTWSGTAFNSDGTLSVSATVSAAVQTGGYLSYNSDSKWELLLYKTAFPGDASTAPGATQIGGTINAGTLDTTPNPAYTWTSLDYGYYTIRARYVDISDASTMENCWTEWYGIVQAEVCDDINNPSYSSTPSDPILRLPNANLCSSVIRPCCEMPAIHINTNVAQQQTDPCDSILGGSVFCENVYGNLNIPVVAVEWYFSPNGTSWTSIASYTITNLSYLNSTNIWLTPNNNPLSTNLWAVHGSGHYMVKIITTPVDGEPCTNEVSGFFRIPRSGCMDQTAHNYDPLAVCPGPCDYPTYDCDAGTGICSDPYPGPNIPYTPGAYNCLTGPGCCENYCEPPPEPGCTDPCATNYDSSASIDDGSCTYTACLDTTAINTYMNCCLNSVVPQNAIISADNECCIDPCVPHNTLSLSTTPSTSTCTSFIADGSVSVTFTINNTATTWTWVIYDSGGAIYTDTTIYSGSGTSSAYSLLSTGTYMVEVTDSLGCHWKEGFTIESSAVGIGCMDPNATNYDPNAVCDCGCCEVCGCMDPNATNYNPNANAACECEYDINPAGRNACIPQSINKTKDTIKACLTIKGTDWLQKYKIGTADDCTLMNKWKLILIDYLLDQHKEGLDCLFNCADAETADATTVQNCSDLWVAGGPSTGLNHSTLHEGASIVNLGEGTTITEYDNFPTGWFGYVGGAVPTSNKSFVGDVVKFDLPTGHPLSQWLNGTIWTLTAIPANGTMHEGSHNDKIGHYTQCLDHNTISITTTVNYYDNFINFANKFCQDCNISILQERKTKG